MSAEGLRRVPPVTKVRQGLECCHEPSEPELGQLDEAPDLSLQSRLGCHCVPDGSSDLVVEVPSRNKNIIREALTYFTGSCLDREWKHPPLVKTVSFTTSRVLEAAVDDCGIAPHERWLAALLLRIDNPQPSLGAK